MATPAPPEPRDWDDLPAPRRTELLVAYGHHLDRFPGTCSLYEKERRFRAWLAERGIRYRARP